MEARDCWTVVQTQGIEADLVNSPVGGLAENSLDNFPS